MTDEPLHSPWICHICDATAHTESLVCSVCYRTTCALHLRQTTVYNQASGLYELQPVCLACVAEKLQ